MSERKSWKMQVSIRRFEERDIPNKVRWINDPLNNKFLHYDLPLETEKTKIWFENTKNNINRYDAVIEADGIACGTVGLLNIDKKNHKSEFYIAMGEHSYKGKGIATKAGKLILDYAFKQLHLNKVYLFTEINNIAAQRLFKRLGFIKEGCLRKDIVSHGEYADRFIYGICADDYLKED